MGVKVNKCITVGQYTKTVKGNENKKALCKLDDNLQHIPSLREPHTISVFTGWETKVHLSRGWSV